MSIFYEIFLCFYDALNLKNKINLLQKTKLISRIRIYYFENIARLIKQSVFFSCYNGTKNDLF